MTETEILEAVKAMMSSSGYLMDTAVRKDTVILPAGGYVVIAIIVADNPGYWFLHCHIEVHQLEGMHMAVIIQEYDESEHKYNLPDDINKTGKFNWTLADFNRLTNAGHCTLASIQLVGTMFLVITMMHIIY